MNIIALPNQKIQKQHKEKVNINKKIYIVTIGMFLITIAFYTLPFNMSLFLEEEHIGGASLSGIALAISTFGAFASGMILSKIKNKIKGFTVPFALVLMCIG